MRFSLLASLGLLPLACGGTARGNGGDGGGGAGGAQAQGGADAQGGTSAGAGTAAVGGKGGGETQARCTSPKTDPKTGLVTCSEGYVHRPNAPTCNGGSVGGAPAEGGAGGASAEGGAGDVDPGTLPRVFEYVPCRDDASVCDAFQYGYCDSQQEAVCASGCRFDADCGPEAICICGDARSPSGGTCHSSSCVSDAECQPGYLCASYTSGCGGGYACQTPQDTCKAQGDCKAAEVCQPGGEGHRVCSAAAVCGRPFLVEAHARLAPVHEGDAWSNVAGAAPRVDHLSADERAAQAEHWSRLGQMEHASIAAFARFSLQLLALGAPPELVDACTQALADETAHTRLCFRIASAYAGRALGPGPLDVSGSLTQTSLSDIVDLVIAEGCFGETSAALQALEAAATASDPVIRAAYERIAVDEERHAELAFRFVLWALGRDPIAVGERLRAVHRQPPAAHALAWNVTLPCLNALLAAA